MTTHPAYPSPAHCNPSRFLVNREWNTLSMPAGTPLAQHLCARCAAPGAHRLERLRLSYAPEWVLVFMLVSPLACLLVWSAIRKVWTVDTPLCRRCSARAAIAQRLVAASFVMGGLCAAIGVAGPRLAVRLFEQGYSVPVGALMVFPLLALASYALPIVAMAYRHSRCVRLVDAREVTIPAYPPQRIAVLRLANLHSTAIDAVCWRVQHHGW